MTAEVVVMNKSAVAVAADSAVTIEMRHGNKIYTTNKVFTLSKYQPVGIMIYGKAELLQIPWETIIKVFRRRLGDRKSGLLDEYAQDFVRFCEKSTSLFSEKHQRQYFKEAVHSYFVTVA